MFNKYKKLIIVLVIFSIICLIFWIIVVYLFSPASYVRFGKPEVYEISTSDLLELQNLKNLMASDSTRFCEADFNGDGTMDRAIAGSFRTTIIFNLGTNKEKIISRSQIGTSGFTCISCADMNQDGKIDLLLGDFGDQGIDILYNNGKGDFIFGTLWKRSERIMLKPNGIFFIVKDINHDDKPDIIYQANDRIFYQLINLGSED